MGSAEHWAQLGVGNGNREKQKPLNLAAPLLFLFQALSPYYYQLPGKTYETVII